MIKISKKSQYGLRAMVFLAREYAKKQPCSVKAISLKEGVPFDFLEKIISAMERAGLVHAKKGVQGGYILQKNPAKITARDIVVALEGNKKPVDCALCGKMRQCAAKNVWKKIDDSFNKTLKSITLAQLIK